jgi:diguanylate cyclase (GGDEF)-like protein
MHVTFQPYRRIEPGYLLLMAIASLAAVAYTFVLSESPAPVDVKAKGVSSIVAVFLILYFWLNWRQSTRAVARPAADPDADPAYDKLEALTDAAEFFAGSIKTSDIFRLVASRVRDVIPVGPIGLYLRDDSTSLRLIETDGADGSFVADIVSAENCFAKRTPVVNESGIVATPLMNAGEPFGVLELHFKPTELPAENGRYIFDAISTRVSPMILNSLAFERSVSNALMDVTTDLPNERALYLILENQIAESQRKRNERPLTLLAIDICGFDEINRKFGHAAGDRALTFIADVVRDNLRQMDFLVRCSDDEFLAVLPTASKQMSEEIVQRITTALFGRTLPVADGHSVSAELNFGWSAFGDDGETAEQLIAAARLRKDQRKSMTAHNVLWFPHDTSS